MEIKDLNNLQPITWGFVVMLLLVTIVPGYLLIFLFNEDLFLEVDTVKLLFLAVSFTMPLWSFNTFVCFFNKENEMSVVERLQFNGLLGAFCFTEQQEADKRQQAIDDKDFKTKLIAP